MDPTNDLWFQIGITPAGALGVVIAATVIYVVFTAVIVVWWRHCTPRIRRSRSR